MMGSLIFRIRRARILARAQVGRGRLLRDLVVARAVGLVRVRVLDRVVGPRVRAIQTGLRCSGGVAVGRITVRGTALERRIRVCRRMIRIGRIFRRERVRILGRRILRVRTLLRGRVLRVLGLDLVRDRVARRGAEAADRRVGQRRLRVGDRQTIQTGPR